MNEHDAPELNPYAVGQQAPDETAAFQPTSVPKWMGMLNLIFSSTLLLCLLSYGFQVFYQGVLGKSMMGPQEDQFKEIMEQARRDQVNRLQDFEDNADNEEEAVRFREAREKIESLPPPTPPDMRKISGMQDPGVFYSYLVDVSTGTILNVLMFVSGLGLLNRREWARKVSLWVAGLKLVRLVIVSALTILVIAPAVSAGLGGFIADMVNMDPNAPQANRVPIEQITNIYYISITIWGGMLLVFGSIYPLVSLRLLTRPHVIQAFKDQEQNIIPAETF